MPQNPLNAAHRPLGALGLSIMITALLTPLAGAQSESELRQQGARQTQQIKDLQAELIALQTRIQELEGQMADLRTALAELASSQKDTQSKESAPPSVATPAQVDPTKPQLPVRRPKNVYQSPDTVLNTMRWNFEREVMKDPSFALGVDSDNERARAEAASMLASWIAGTNRSFRKSITWSVKILDEQTQPDGSAVYTLQALAPNGSNAGKPFLQPASARIARRVTGWEEQPDLERLLLKGMLEPNLTPINQQPTVEYSRGNIIEVSPYVQFAFKVKISSMMPIFVERTPDTKDPTRPEEIKAPDGS